MADASAEEVRRAARAAIDRLHHTLRAVAIGRPTAKAAATAAAASDAASGAGAAAGRGGTGGSFVVEQTARLRGAVLDALGVDSWEALAPSRAVQHAFALLSGTTTPGSSATTGRPDLTRMAHAVGGPQARRRRWTRFWMRRPTADGRCSISRARAP